MAVRIRDDRDRELVFARPPMRIVSLVPSDTDTLFAIGAGERVVGRTRYCVEPVGELEDVAVCGGTKDVDVDAVCELRPDLVVANQEENSRAGLAALIARRVPVFISFPRRVAEGLAHAARLARLLGVAGQPAVRELFAEGYGGLREAAARRVEPLPVFVPIWMEPLMTFCAGTFADDMLALAGARNVFADRQRLYPLAADFGERAPLPDDAVQDRDTRYPRLRVDELVARDPTAVLLPDEPHEFGPEDAKVFAGQSTTAARLGNVVFCDGKDLFWYGTRSIAGLPRLTALIDSLRAPADHREQ